MILSEIELRVLGCLIEKAHTTPDQYPLTTNSLMLACNQKTSREPVMVCSEAEVEQAIVGLREAGLARTIKPSGTRVYKHKHVVDESMGLSAFEMALLSVLMLRGPQSPGELKQRTDRYCNFESLEEVESVLSQLSQRDDSLAQNMGRMPGQSQDRWVHLLSDPQVSPHPEVVKTESGDGQIIAPARSSANSDIIARLEQIEKRLAVLEHDLGVSESVI